MPCLEELSRRDLTEVPAIRLVNDTVLRQGFIRELEEQRVAVEPDTGVPPG
jgi:hypothetical protein